MSDSKLVFIFGYSGHAYVIIESLLDAGYCIEGYFDFKKAEKNPFQLRYLGFENNENLPAIIQHHLVFPTVGENSIRKKLITLFDNFSLSQFAAVDPCASVSASSKIGTSTYIGKNSSINALAELGNGVIINTNAVVEHECIIDHYCHIAPGAVLCGNVKVGKSSFIGANTVVKQNIEIAEKTTIGAGSVVVKSIPTSEGTWIGNPVKLK